MISFHWVLWGRKRSAVPSGISTKQSSNHKEWWTVPASREAAPTAVAVLHCSYGYLLQPSQWAASKTGTGNRLDSFKLNKTEMPNRPVANIDHIQPLELNFFFYWLKHSFFPPVFKNCLTGCKGPADALRLMESYCCSKGQRRRRPAPDDIRKQMLSQREIIWLLINMWESYVVGFLLNVGEIHKSNSRRLLLQADIGTCRTAAWPQFTMLIHWAIMDYILGNLFPDHSDVSFNCIKTGWLWEISSTVVTSITLFEFKNHAYPDCLISPIHLHLHIFLLWRAFKSSSFNQRTIFDPNFPSCSKAASRPNLMANVPSLYSGF